MDKAIRKAKYCYEQNKKKPEVHKDWKDKKKSKCDQRKKGFKPRLIKRSQIVINRISQHKVRPSQLKQRGKGQESLFDAGDVENNIHSEIHKKVRRSCSSEGKERNTKNVHNIRGATTVNDVAKTIPRIYATLEDHQADNQSTVLKVSGKIAKQYLSILIDPGSSHSYVTPKVVSKCALKKCKHSKSWLVQLAIGTKIEVSEMVERCPLELNGIFIRANLNILPLGSYDVLIGID